MEECCVDKLPREQQSQARHAAHSKASPEQRSPSLKICVGGRGNGRRGCWHLDEFLKLKEGVTCVERAKKTLEVGCVDLAVPVPVQQLEGGVQLAGKRRKMGSSGKPSTVTEGNGD